ncbi:MAG: hypothetical protein FD166_2558 [Bacteroidetes bacterium]|nr:MAG: hypothetical protein FD166_2558 [Bacteroidota bacterium]
MKYIIPLTRTILICGLFLGLNLSVFAQGGPPPPPPGGGHGQGTNQPPQGGNAPVGGGLFMLIGLGVAWGAGKVIADRREKE